MQASWQYLLIVSFFSIAYGQFETKDIRSISSGTSFGMCRGYCRQSINVTSNPFQVVALKEPNFAQNPYPSVQRLFSSASSQWEELMSLVNLKSFTTLGDTIGCPDCADGGAEWIQVDWIKGSKRVTFENGRTVKGVQPLIEKLRQMREAYLTQIET